MFSISSFKENENKNFVVVGNILNNSVFICVINNRNGNNNNNNNGRTKKSLFNLKKLLNLKNYIKLPRDEEKKKSFKFCCQTTKLYK